ncbi:hypothetical protein B4Q13_20790, partial [Lacticaseibacillus rhamnosus]
MRPLEKLEIERRYWRARRIDWGLLRECDLDMNFVLNVKWVRMQSAKSRRIISGSKKIDLSELVYWTVTEGLSNGGAEGQCLEFRRKNGRDGAKSEVLRLCRS